jgi:O-antigen/teichoic acid export membrane protein
LLALAIGLALVAQIAAVYGRVDLIVLRRVCGDGVVGQYAVPLRILDAALAAVVAVGGVLQPVLLRALAADAPRLTARTEASVRVLLLASLPAALGVSWLATAILAWFKPEYAAGGPALAVLVWLAPVTGVTFVLHSLLAAAGRAPRVGLCIGLGLATNWALCWLLVPRHGLMGAAWAKLSAELAIALASVWAVRPVVRLGWHRALGPPLLLTAASVATGAWAGPLAGLVVYGGLAAALGVFRGAAWRDA